MIIEEQLPTNQYFYNIVMTQTADYFNRFYHLLLRQQLTDPTLHSEWLYFLSMFKQEPLDPNRLELYLGILASQKHKKQQHKSKQATPLLAQTTKQIHLQPKHKNTCDPQPTPNQFKFQKRLSEHARLPLPSPDFKITTEPLQMRKISSLDEELNRHPRPSLHSDSKNKKNKPEDPTFHLSYTPTLNQYYNSLGLTQMASEIREDQTCSKNKDRHQKLSQLSGKLVKIFQSNSRLRA